MLDAPESLSRNTLRMSGGAATNRTFNDCTTSTMSIGVPVRACMITPPARSPPNKMPASTVPKGLPRPSSATVIASKPMPPAIPRVRARSVPRTCMAPARPASEPAIAITKKYWVSTLIPNARAACGLAPTARNR
jgi:hypothetical protein